MSSDAFSEMEFPGVFNPYFPPRTPCCFVRIHARLGKMPSKYQRRSTTLHSLNVFHRFKHVQICNHCHLKLGNGCFTILFEGAYFLLAVTVPGDESSRLRMAINPMVLAGYRPLLTALV